MENLWLDLSIGLCFVSLSLNAFLIIYFTKVKPKPKQEFTYDAQAILRDLATGPALIKVEYVDRSEVLLRSPRNM